MEEEFEQVYSYYVRRMMLLGCWVIESKDPVKRLLYKLYSSSVTVWVLFMSYMGILDLIDSIPNLDKIFYNTCFNPLIIFSFVKCRLTVSNASIVNGLRKSLFRSVKSCKDEEELAIYNSAVSDLRLITRFFGTLVTWSYPIWLTMSLVSDFFGERQLPLPAKWPGVTDLGDYGVFLPLCLFHAAFALFYIFVIISLEVTMFGLLLQIYREYRFLIKNIREFGEFCDGMNTWHWFPTGKLAKTGEINIFLRRAKAKQMLGKIIIRQKQLLQYTEELESAFHASMFIHIFVGGALLVVNGVQTMIFSSNFSIKMGYQIGYVFAIVCDMLYLCWLANRISIKCFEVGVAFYSTPWYAMDVDIRKDILFVMLRSQKPPRVTSGNFIELNLKTFMAMMKNIYSWLTLFRQVALNPRMP